MKKIILLMFLLTLISCLQTQETIDPFVEPKSLDQAQRELFLNVSNQGLNDQLEGYRPKYSFDESKPDVFFLKVTYNFNDININTLGGGNGNFEILANKFAMFFAKAFFAMGGTYQLDMDEIELEIPELNIDKSIVNAIYIDKVDFEYSEGLKRRYGQKANFQFIEQLEITTPHQMDGFSTPFDLLLFSYHHNKNQCNYQCVRLDIFTYDLLNLMGDTKKFKVKPELSVQQVPIKDMEFSGSIDLILELKLPF